MIWGSQPASSSEQILQRSTESEKEAMRLQPPANVLIRGLDANLALRTSPDETGYDGRDYLLPAGAWVWIDLIGLHKDPRYWSDPHSFDPSRFLGTAGAGGGEGYLPFGGGPRRLSSHCFRARHGKERR